jgi:hypothetical protein
MFMGSSRSGVEAEGGPPTRAEVVVGGRDSLGPEPAVSETAVMDQLSGDELTGYQHRVIGPGLVHPQHDLLKHRDVVLEGREAPQRTARVVLADP